MHKLKRLLSFVRNVLKNRWMITALARPENLKFVGFAWPGHFYSPLPDANEIERKRSEIFDRSMREAQGIELNDKAQVELLKNLAEEVKAWPFPETQMPGNLYWADNEYFAFGDGSVAFGMLQHFKPERVVEVGSGFSSAMMLEVNRRFRSNEMSLTFVEPYPDRLNSLLDEAGQSSCRIMENSVQETDPALFQILKENDILFIDSTHISKIGSDVNHLLFQVLPLLSKGVIVHIHDILWPFEYPESWVDQGRAWNEAYMLRAFLQYNSDFEILYFNHYMETHHRDLLETEMPLNLKQSNFPGTPGNSSIWLRKVK